MQDSYDNTSISNITDEPNVTVFVEDKATKDDFAGGSVQSPVWGSYMLLTSAVALLVLVVEALTFYGMVNMKRLPFATKFLFCLNLAFDCGFIAIIVIASPVNYIFGQTDLATDIGSQIGRLCMAGSWLCLALLSLERFYCIALPNDYIRLVSKPRVIYVSSVCLVTACTGKLFTRYFIIPKVHNHEGYTFENSEDTNILTWFFGICTLVCIICNGLVLRIVNRHKREVLKQVSSIGGDVKHINPLRSFKSTNMVWVLNAFFIGLYLPWLLIKLIRVDDKTTSALRSIDFIFMMISCFVNPIIYAWRLEECRYHILAFLGKFNSRIAVLAERRRLAVFSIMPPITSVTGSSATKFSE